MITGTEAMALAILSTLGLADDRNQVLSLNLSLQPKGTYYNRAMTAANLVIKASVPAALEEWADQWQSGSTARARTANWYIKNKARADALAMATNLRNSGSWPS